MFLMQHLVLTLYKPPWTMAKMLALHYKPLTEWKSIRLSHSTTALSWHCTIIRWLWTCDCTDTCSNNHGDDWNVILHWGWGHLPTSINKNAITSATIISMDTCPIILVTITVQSDVSGDNIPWFIRHQSQRTMRRMECNSPSCHFGQITDNRMQQSNTWCPLVHIQCNKQQYYLQLLPIFLPTIS